ncbi:MAG: hypothetical protein A3F11_05145 [Gammaproteobacteria bacterium RIFCSPHIGHO2_12_FULL_37_14]|nr:MAG: hypothetical protein A3F11_05145 [Gammaproteobacteria bacterium RIFCSPHIGHO2_12_FULL_37_14]
MKFSQVLIKTLSQWAGGGFIGMVTTIVFDQLVLLSMPKRDIQNGLSKDSNEAIQQLRSQSEAASSPNEKLALLRSAHALEIIRQAVLDSGYKRKLYFGVYPNNEHLDPQFYYPAVTAMDAVSGLSLTEKYSYARIRIDPNVTNYPDDDLYALGGHEARHITHHHSLLLVGMNSIFWGLRLGIVLKMLEHMWTGDAMTKRLAYVGFCSLVFDEFVLARTKYHAYSLSNSRDKFNNFFSKKIEEDADCASAELLGTATSLANFYARKRQKYFVVEEIPKEPQLPPAEHLPPDQPISSTRATILRQQTPLKSTPRFFESETYMKLRQEWLRTLEHNQTQPPTIYHQLERARYFTGENKKVLEESTMCEKGKPGKTRLQFNLGEGEDSKKVTIHPMLPW